jgi:hypothetical protein
MVYKIEISLEWTWPCPKMSIAFVEERDEDGERGFKDDGKGKKAG